MQILYPLEQSYGSARDLQVRRLRLAQLGETSLSGNRVTAIKRLRSCEKRLLKSLGAELDRAVVGRVVGADLTEELCWELGGRGARPPG